MSEISVPEMSIFRIDDKVETYLVSGESWTKKVISTLTVNKYKSSTPYTFSLSHK